MLKNNKKLYYFTENKEMMMHTGCLTILKTKWLGAKQRPRMIE